MSEPETHADAAPTRTVPNLVFDVVGLVASAIGLGWGVVALVSVQPSFLKMFADFGGELPRLTAFFLEPWVPLALAVAPPTLIAEGMVRGAGPLGRAARASVAVVLTLLFPAAFWMAMYLPLFGLAEAVK